MRTVAQRENVIVRSGDSRTPAAACVRSRCRACCGLAAWSTASSGPPRPQSGPATQAHRSPVDVDEEHHQRRAGPRSGVVDGRDRGDRARVLVGDRVEAARPAPPGRSAGRARPGPRRRGARHVPAVCLPVARPPPTPAGSALSNVGPVAAGHLLVVVVARRWRRDAGSARRPPAPAAASPPRVGTGRRRCRRCRPAAKPRRPSSARSRRTRPRRRRPPPARAHAGMPPTPRRRPVRPPSVRPAPSTGHRPTARRHALRRRRHRQRRRRAGRRRRRASAASTAAYAARSAPTAVQRDDEPIVRRRPTPGRRRPARRPRRRRGAVQRAADVVGEQVVVDRLRVHDTPSRLVVAGSLRRCDGSPVRWFAAWRAHARIRPRGGRAAPPAGPGPARTGS